MTTVSRAISIILQTSSDSSTFFIGQEGDGWVVQTITAGSSQPDTILTRNLVLSAGLSCVNLLNPLLPAHERLTAYYSKGQCILPYRLGSASTWSDPCSYTGSYLSYKGPGVGQVSRLLYPCPEPGLAGLGTHLVSNPAIAQPLLALVTDGLLLPDDRYGG